MSRKDPTHETCEEPWSVHAIVRRGKEWLWQCPDGRVNARVPDAHRR